MKLYFSPHSPYVRKVMACAVARGIEARIKRVISKPFDLPADLLADNPLSKVPTLVTDDGLALFDSPVICEYLDVVGDAPPLFPQSGPDRWMALKFQALADGILDAAVRRLLEERLPQDEARSAFSARQKAAIKRALNLLDRDADALQGAWTIGSLAVACSLGYLDFRYGHEPWRGDRPRLAAWYAGVRDAPPLSRTVPTG